MSEPAVLPYSDAEQQREAAHLGMWVFLATELLFFGGLFLAFAAYRHLYPREFLEGSQHMAFWIGTANTAVLLTASFAMAAAVRQARRGGRLRLCAWLAASALLGVVFLGFKGWEYGRHVREHLLPGSSFAVESSHPRRVELYLYLYFAMTGLHAAHVLIGTALIACVALMAWRGRFGPEYHTPVELAGLYWHFVDAVWIFLYALLYLHPRR